MLIALVANAQVQDTFFGCKLGMTKKTVVAGLQRNMKILWEFSTDDCIIAMGKGGARTFTLGGFFFNMAQFSFYKGKFAKVTFDSFHDNYQEASKEKESIARALSDKYEMIDIGGGKFSMEDGPVGVYIRQLDDFTVELSYFRFDYIKSSHDEL